MTSNASRDAIVCHLGEILASPTFARSKRLAAFLSWVVTQSLSGDCASITERNIALRVYGKPSDFDAKIDGIIRVEAMRLRHKLREYYESAPGGRRIEIPKGSYAPVFSGFENAPTWTQSIGPPRQFWMPPRAAFLMVTAALLLAYIGWYSFSRPSRSAGASHLVAEANRLRLIGENLPASVLLDQAMALDPDSSDVHLARAAVFQSLGHYNQARVEAVQAEVLAARHGRTVPDAEARISALDFDLPCAIERVRAMLRNQPESMDLLQELAGLELESSDVAAALATIDAARRLPDAARNPELDRLEGLALAAQGMYGNLDAVQSRQKMGASSALVLRGEQKAAALHATSALARLMVLDSGLEIGRTEIESALILKRARDLCLSIHDDICVARTYRIRGNQLVGAHQFQEALRFYRQGLPLAREWQNWREIEHLLGGIDTAMENLHLKLTPANFRYQSFELLPQPQH